MQNATHRIVGVIELDVSFGDKPRLTLEQFNGSSRTTESSDTIRRIRDNLAEARLDAPLVFEPQVQINSVQLAQDLEAEFDSLVTA